MAHHLVIAILARGDTWDALGIPLASSGRTFGLTLIGDIVEFTDGYQDSLQFFGGFLCSRVPKPTVDRADHQALEPALLHELDLAFFEDRYEVAGSAGQRLLDAMACHGGLVTPSRSSTTSSQLQSTNASDGRGSMAAHRGRCQSRQYQPGRGLFSRRGSSGSQMAK